MSKIQKVITFTFLLFLIAITSCRKSYDSINNDVRIQSLPDLKEKFLNVPGKLPPILQRIANILKKQDEKKEFVNALANFQGIPVWERAKISKNYDNSGSLNSIIEGDSTIVIPLVLTDMNFVNAIIVCSERDSTFDFNLYNCNDYKKFGYEKASGQHDANDIVSLFIGFEYSVFKHDQFLIYDQNLTRYKQFERGSANYLKIKPKQQTDVNTANVFLPVLDCWEEAWFHEAADGTVTQTTEWVEVCNTIWVYIDYGVGGGGPGSETTWVPPHTGGGTSSGGSGSTGYSSTVNYVKNKAYLTTNQANWLSSNSSVASMLYTGLQNDINNQDPIGEDIYSASAPSESVISTKITVDAGMGTYVDGPYDFSHYNLITQYSTVSPDLHIPPVYWALFNAHCAILKYENPEWSIYKVYWEATKELVHLGLDVIGLFPGLGEIADLTNGVLYTVQGDGVNASLSFASAIPFFGWWTAGAKMAMRTVQITAATKTTLKWIRVGDMIAFGSRSQLRKVLNLVKFDGKIAHHVIPWEFRNHPIVQLAAKSKKAFHMNEFSNGIPLESAIHAGNHLDYNARIFHHLEQLNVDYPNMDPDDAYSHLMNLINRIKAKIGQESTTHINNLTF